MEALLDSISLLTAPGVRSSLLAATCRLSLDALESGKGLCEQEALALRSIGTILLYSPTLVHEIPQRIWQRVQTQAADGTSTAHRRSPQQAVCAAMLALRPPK
jgi:hypothetical protein